MSSETTYNYVIGTGEIAGLIIISRGFSNPDFSLYEFHVFDNIAHFNHISGSEHIQSCTYENGTLKIICDTTWLRIKMLLM